MKVTFFLKMGAEVVFPIAKGWLAIATLKPTFTFLGRDFCHIQYFYLAKSLPRKVKVGFRVAMASQPLGPIKIL